MKYITLIIGLLVVGCGTLKDKVIGTYQGEAYSSVVRFALLENGISEEYYKGEKVGSAFYVVDVGEYESVKVPTTNVRG